ncbi:hypothetical protein F4X33_14875 [Candidatus Poribacteria bacterium]|nr:hypothetical protein [Candidatus Poribacteria bacterium]
MQFKLGCMFLVTLIALVVLVGCEVGQDMIMEMMPSTDTGMIDAMEMMSSTDTGVEDMMNMMSSTDTEMADMEAIPVKLVWLVNYPVGRKADYLAWIAAVAPTLLAPEEVNRVASYDNARGENPHRLVEFEFDSYVDAATYLSRPDVAAVFEALPDHSSEVSTHVFAQRSADYSKDENPSRTVKMVYLVDYPLGGKDAYLEYIASIAPSLQAPEEVKRIASYDNLHGATPHRFVEFEFESIEEANTYLEREEIHAVNIELPNRATRVAQLMFEQRPDYVSE